MSESNKRKLRQTTLQFVPNIATRPQRKRKMDESNKEQMDKKTKPDLEDDDDFVMVHGDDRKGAAQTATSPYFNETGKEDDKKAKDLRTADQQEKSKKAAEAAEKRQTENSDSKEKGKNKAGGPGMKEEKETAKDVKGASPSKTVASKGSSPSKGTKNTAVEKPDKVVPEAGTSVDPQPKDEEQKETLQYDLSPELFDNSEPTDDSQDVDNDLYPDIPTKKPSALRKESSWRGIKLGELRTTPTCLGEIKPLGAKNQTVLFKTPYKFEETDVHPPKPYPSDFMDKWDQDHVRMPCSPHNEYPVEGRGGKTVLRRRWELIEEALHRNIPGPFELEGEDHIGNGSVTDPFPSELHPTSYEAILTYNQRYANKWNFAALKHYFTDYIRKDTRKDFFANILPKMVTLALHLPLLCTQPIPLLKQQKKHSITMSQQQAACLLANAFFCTFPRRNARQRHAEYTNYPDINFNNLFQGPPNRRKMEKLRCIVHYFSRVTSEMPLGTVTFERKVIDTFPRWEDLGTDFCKLHVSSSGTIEDDGKGMLQADFANKYIGGGVLGHGCVQEEIRFLICPEMIVTRLFTEVLEKNESLLMMGCEQFSKYDGYADSFSWDGDFIDTTQRDVNGRRHTDVIAIDALVIRDFKKQFQKWCVLRELNKAYVGFHSDFPSHQLSAVCTGNWGCGAFGGDKRLKALIQLMAASVAKRDVCYFTFDDNQLTDELYKMHNFISKENGLSVGNIMQLIDQYNRNVCQKLWWGKPKKNLFEYIVAVFEGNLDSDTTGDGYSEGSPEGHVNWDENEKVDVDNEKDKKKTMNREDSVDYKANTP